MDHCRRNDVKQGKPIKAQSNKTKSDSVKVKDNLPCRVVPVTVLGKGTSLFVEGRLGMRNCKFIIDTGASCSIIKPCLAKGEVLQGGKHIRLKTATGELVPVVGQIQTEIRLGNKTFQHQFLVADIEEECLLGLDFMRIQGFAVDLKMGTFKQGDLEIPVYHKGEMISVKRVLVTKSIVVPAQSESLVWAKIESDKNSKVVGFIEPLNGVEKHGLMIGKTLVRTESGSYVPVRVMNVTECEKQITKGDEIAVCSPVDHIVACTTVVGKNNNKKRMKYSQIQALLEAAKTSLCQSGKAD